MLRRFLTLALALAVLIGAAPSLSASGPAVRRLSVQSAVKELVLGNEGLSQVNMTVRATPENADISAVVWSVNKPQIARISDDGVLSAVSGGSVKVTALDELTGKKASKTLRVWELPSSVRIKTKEKSIKAGKTLKLSVSVEPSSHVRKADKALSWFSSAPEIASVDAKGKIKGLSPGKALITVMTVNGLSASYTITVAG